MARRPARVPLVIDVDYGSECAPLRRRTRNIGAGGLFIETADPLPEGTPVRVRFVLPDRDRPMAVEAAVAWAEPLLGMGLRFTWVDPGDQAAIRDYVVRHLGPATREPDGLGTGATGLVEGIGRASDAPALRAAPGQPAPASTLYLAAPADLRARLEAFLASEGVPYAVEYPSLLAVPLADGRLPSVREALRGLLGEADRLRCKAVVMPGRTRPTLADLVGMATLGGLIAAIDGETLATMLREARLVTHFQPVVLTRDPEVVFAYEALVRGRAADGTLVTPRELYATARAVGLVSSLDRLARLAAVRSAAEHALTSRLFLNVNPASLGATDEHLEATAEAVAEAGLPPGHVVFEIVESDRIDDVRQLLRILGAYREAGFGVALDDLGTGYSSLTLLAQLRPDYIKLDIALVRDIAADPYRGEIVARLLESARALGVRTVAEGVETEAEWRWFFDHGVDLVQGYLFAAPASPPPAPRRPASRPAS